MDVKVGLSFNLELKSFIFNLLKKTLLFVQGRGIYVRVSAFEEWIHNTMKTN